MPELDPNMAGLLWAPQFGLKGHEPRPIRLPPPVHECSKVDYPDARAAHAAVRANAKRGRKNYAYQCRHCGLWHLTSAARR